MGNNDYISLLKIKFHKVYKEIEYLKSEIYKTKGWWFFKEHIYTVDELLNSGHHNQVCAYTEKIGSDCESWYKYENFSEEGKMIYYEKREDVEYELQEVNEEIRNRKPLWWEKVKGVFYTFIVRVMENMPDLVRNFIEETAKKLRLPVFIRKIFRLPNFGKK